MKWGRRVVTKEIIINTGDTLRNFFSMMVAYHLINFDDDLALFCKDVTESLSDDYALYLKFIETKGEKYDIPGLDIRKILNLPSIVLGLRRENVSKDYIVNNFGGYIRHQIELNPSNISHFWDIMTDDLKKEYEHFGMKFGFFDD